MVDYSKISMKRIAAMALILNAEDDILIVKPKYHEGWLLPGGIIEGNESPRNACIREVQEEIGIVITPKELLIVDYKDSQGEKSEAIHFVFNGGKLETTEIKLQEEELSEYRFVNLRTAEKLTIQPISQRLKYAIEAIKNGKTFYLENQKTV